MKSVPIKVRCVAQTKLNWPEIIGWLESVGVKAPDTVKQQLSVATDSAGLIALAGKRCYASFEEKLNPNVSRIRTDMAEYIENILKSGHGSVLEHATASFAIEGVTRVFTAEMNRHRAGIAISEASLRYIRFDDIPYWEPESLKLTDDEAAVHVNWLANVFRDNPTSEVVNIERKVKTREIFAKAFQQDEDNYRQLCELWGIETMTNFHEKKLLTSMFRRIVGMGVSTGGLWTGNMRAWRHILALRTSSGAEEEIRVVFDQVGKHLSQTEPMLFCDFATDDSLQWIPRYPKV